MAKASAFHTFSQNVIRAAELPPRMAAVACSTVASGPYSECLVSHGTGATAPTGSPISRSCWGVIT